MKYGMRKPSVKKSISSRTTGAMKRSVKRSVNPMYGKKGIGAVNDPKKAAYNSVYNRTTTSVDELLQYDRNQDDEPVSILGLIGSFFCLLLALLQTLFWIAILVGIIWLVVAFIRM